MTTDIQPYDAITGHVLSMADSGRLTKRTQTDGAPTIHIDDADPPAPECSYIYWALTILQDNHLIRWEQCRSGITVALPTTTGVDALEKWEAEFLALTPPVSDRPLLNPACLNDLEFLGLSPTKAAEIEAGFTALDNQQRNT
jgi:hypothetical protein